MQCVRDLLLCIVQEELDLARSNATDTWRYFNFIDKSILGACFDYAVKNIVVFDPPD